MIEVLEPQDALLRGFVDSIYVFRKSDATLEFASYPTVNTPVAIFRNAALRQEADGIVITASDAPNHFTIACNQFSSGLRIRYEQLVDEIAINFKPLGLASFLHSAPRPEKHFYAAAWDEQLPALLDEVLASSERAQQLRLIETFLLRQYTPLADEAMLLQALAMLNDVTAEYKMQEIAAMVGVHYKQLYRQFREQVGCSMAHYRNIVKFRSSIVSKMAQDGKARLVDICYENGYTDQPYFIRQFRQLTGEKPARFFKDLRAFGTGKVIFRME